MNIFPMPLLLVNLHHLQSVIKYFDKNKKIKLNWLRQENFDISFSVSFDRYCLKLMFGGEPGH